LLAGRVVVRHGDSEHPAVMCVRYCLSVDGYPMERLARLHCLRLFTVLQHEATLRNGIYYVVDLTNTGWSDFSLTLHRFMSRILQDRMPTRVQKILIVNAPSMFGFFYKLAAPFIKAKFRERLQFVDHAGLNAAIGSNLVFNFIEGGQQEWDKEGNISRMQALAVELTPVHKAWSKGKDAQ
jgi:hypothetical protein